MILEHNKETFEEAKAMLEEFKECCIVGDPGIGKSNIATELMQYFGNLSTLIISPKVSISANWENMPDKYNFPPTISTITYQYFNTHYKELYGFDMYIFDEAHHVGANEWSNAFRNFKEGLNNEYVIGLTATPIRYNDKYKNIGINEFNGHVVYGHDHKSAIELGIFQEPLYVRALYDIECTFNEYSKKPMSDELRGKLEFTKNNTIAIKDIVLRNLPNSDHVKGIVFVDSIDAIENGIKLIKDIFPNENISYIHSKVSKKINITRLEEFNNSKSGFMISVRMLDEGLHVDGVNITIMLRKTCSPSVYIQQIGRMFSINGEKGTIYDFVSNWKNISKTINKINNSSKNISINQDIDYIKNIYHDNKNNEEKISDQVIVKDYTDPILKIFAEIDEYNNKIKRWTKEEDDILREYYPTMGSKVVNKLPGRSYNACRIRASALGIINTNRWTKEEDDIIREYYPTMGGKVVNKLPGRTVDMCRARAKTLGITSKNKKWTKEEDDILREYYPTMGSKVVNKLPGRTLSNCVVRANILGIVTNTRWTKEEDDILREYYPTMGSNVSDKLPRKNKISCIRRASFLGIVIYTRWTKEEDDILREYYPTMGGKVVNKLPGKSYNACRKIVNYLKSRKEWL